MNYESARRQMLSQQIRTWDVLDQRVLDTLKDTPRELFVPESERDLAFADIEVPLAHQQCMMTPKVEARMLQELAIEASDHVLEIGTGSGYLAACLSRLASRVTSLEIYPDLSESAGASLASAGIESVELRAEDATLASFERKFDVIAVTASVPEATSQFTDLLETGGRMFIVIGQAPVMQATLIRHLEDGGLSSKSLFETVLTPMINVDQRKAFVL